MEFNYICKFIGRSITADGITSQIEITITATDEASANIKLYDNYEHISKLQIILDGENNRYKHEIGLAITKLFNLEVDNFKYNTAIGTKTPIGIYNTVKRIIDDNQPRMHEIFIESSRK